MPERSHFVILYHRLKASEHWDLMLEQGEILLTWQLERDPTGPSPFPIPARRIGDHRKAYLTYEGPISGDRGEVRRVDAGTLDFDSTTADRVVFTLAGGRLRGRFVLAIENGDWTLQVV